MSLVETLKAAKARAAAENDVIGRASVLREWQEAIHRFSDKTAAWLDEYINSGLLRVDLVNAKIKEEPFGEYEAKIIRLYAGNQTVVFQPIGRFITGATGRIDMFAQGRGSVHERYRFLRKEEGADDYWTMQPPEGHKTVLDFLAADRKWHKQAIEAALDRVLR